MAAAAEPGSVASRTAAIERARAFSPFLAAALEAFPNVVAAFAGAGSDAAIAAALSVDAPDVAAELRVRRSGLALAAALGDLAGELSLEKVTAVLSDFADAAIEQALRAAIVERTPGAEPEGFAVIALGKLGSRELNFSSDVDLLLLFDPLTLPRRARDDPGEAAVRIGRRLIELLQQRTGEGYVVRVDLRLRPAPEVTPIVLPVNAALSHYESSAQPWERAALIRARHCAGDPRLAEQFLGGITPFVWRRSLDYGAIDEIRSISARIRDHHAHGARLGPGFDLKRGRGGIREVEFFTQIHQMIHGGRDPALRAPATLDGLRALREAGRLEADDADALANAYRVLRTIEHRVQMIADAQTHRLPAEKAALEEVARLHGLVGGDALIALLKPNVSRVEALFDGLAPRQDDRLPSEPDALAAALTNLGFAQPEEPMRHVADWRSARARSLRSPAAQAAFESMLPTLLQAIAAGRDPSHALNRLSDIVERLSSGVNFFRLLQARQPLSELLARILAHAPALSDQLSRRPGLIEGLIDSSSFDPPPSPERFAEGLAATMAGQPYDVALDRARQLVNERRFALGVQLIDQRSDPLEIAAGYARVAEGALLALAGAATAEFEAVHGRIPRAELVVLGLGRLGGCALTHASDLDLIFLHSAAADALSDGPRTLGPSDYFNRLAARVVAALSVPTASGPLYDVDTRLRPQGAQGMLAVSLDAFAKYQAEEAWTWEHMALCRARPVFGSDKARGEVEQIISTILGKSRDRAKVAADAAAMRREMDRHKPAKGPFDVKLGRGGLVDLEFATHVMQLTTGERLSPRLEVALPRLAELDLIEESVVEAQLLLTRMLVMMRLVAPADVKITEAMWDLIAATCGFPNGAALLAQHERARQSVAKLWDRIRETADDR